MEFERQYVEFTGKRHVQPGKEECLIWSATWARGVMVMIEGSRMKLRGAISRLRSANPAEKPIHAEHH
jgi:hypothetical protein